MYYYEVWVASQRFHGDKPLTYASKMNLARGTLVVVPLQQQPVIGIVIEQSNEPSFKTKEISRQIGSNSLPDPLIKLIDWLRLYYPASLGGLLQAFLPSTLLKTSRLKETTDRAVKSFQPKIELPKLTAEQESAISTIESSNQTTTLIHGDTGSGKTRVYIELVRKAFAKQQSSIILTPEIGLTPQLAQTFLDTFGDRVVVLHSGLTAAQRRDIWLRVLESDEPLIVVGTRSALFAPIKKVGLIVIDEMHDQAYKQESAPYYQATRVAGQLAKLHQSKLIMGSATPPAADYYLLQKKGVPIVRMSESAIGRIRPADIETVKLENREHFTRSAHLSNQLIKHVETALANNEQSIIFLNRRGTARVVLCQRCGWQSLCPRCDITLTYHGDSHRVLCHTCGHNTVAPPVCPSCNNHDISFKSIGTKYLVDELMRIFPKARVQRFDTDSTKSERLEQQYKQVKSGKIDILVGTQLLSKGLDLPQLSVIGVVLADTGLLIPDFTANELTYQQLTQIMGRVGRGHRHGHIVIQSYHPDNPAIKTAIQRDYQAFYEQEIAERKQYNFPPFVFLLKLACMRANNTSAQNACNSLAESLGRQHPKLEIIGPTPAFHAKQNNKFRWQLIVKSSSRQVLTEIIRELPTNWSYDIDPANLL
ncbi:MAG: primosomal protein N' [Candidatus Saccharibacteria bacterium]|nr:primosomal protein N' [Candidatus Saccharibacteria bacterium]